MDVNYGMLLFEHIVTDDDGSLKLKQLDELTNSKAYLDFSRLLQEQNARALFSPSPQRRNAKSAHFALTKGAMRGCTMTKRTGAGCKLGLDLYTSKYKMPRTRKYKYKS